MDQVLNILGDRRVLILIAAAVVILASWYISTRIKTKKYRKRLAACQSKYGEIKNMTLQFKMNKAGNLSKVDSDTVSKVREAQEIFDRYESSITSISEHLSSAEDNILTGKLKKADLDLDKLETELKDADQISRTLNDKLDDILAEEVSQRQQVNAYKNRFRALKSAAAEHSSDLSYCWGYLEKKISATEQMFSTFEEWIYSSDFDKANDELTAIGKSLDEIEACVNDMPGLLQDARGIIPRMAEEMRKDYARERDRGVYLDHIQVTENLNALTDALKGDLKKMKNGSMAGVRDNLDAYKARIQQLDEMIHKEGQAYDEIAVLRKETDDLYESAGSKLRYVKEQYPRTSSKFGLEGFNTEIAKRENQYNELKSQKDAMAARLNDTGRPASETVVELKNVHGKVATVESALSKMQEKIEAASTDEDRARKQLVKLQIIMNQIQVKMRKYRLPNISAKYDADMKEALGQIDRIKKLLDETPLNMQAVNSLLQKSLDFIYRLYNDVNNVVGTVVMVENTIVFGNRYRSTYADIDSELTRAELAFRNGEYTQALTMAIATIEKIHPGNYEHMIKENAKGA